MDKMSGSCEQSQFVTVTKSKPVSFPTKRCLKHPMELINVYCRDHDVVCCASCKAFEHSNCTKTQHLIDAAKGVQTSQEFKNIKKETDILMTDVVKILADRKADISRIDNKKQNIKQIIADFRKNVNKYFDDLEERSLDELNNKAAIIVRDCEQDTKDLAFMKSKAEDVLKQLESFKGDNECDLFVQVKTGTQFLRNAMNKVITISKNVQKDDITFKIDPRIEQLLRSVEVLGTFTDVPTDTSRLVQVKTGTQFLRNAMNKVITISKNVQKDDITFKIDPRIEQLLRSVEVLGTFTDVPTDTSRLVQVKTGTQFLRNAMNKVITISKSVQKDDITFKIDPRIEQLLRSVEALGTITDVPTDTSQLATVPAVKNITQPRAHFPSPHTSRDYRDPLPTYKAQLHGKIDVKEKSDSDSCIITDICQLLDGTILIIDYHNRKLKRLDDQSYKLLDSLRLTSNPTCVCNVGPCEVAMSLSDDKKVQFISVENKLTLTRSFSTGSSCIGLVYVDDKLYVCSGIEFASRSCCIEVYNKAGQLQHYIRYVPPGMCHVPRYLTVSDDGQHLFVTSSYNKYVTMMDLTGNVVNTFSDSNLEGITRVCTDGKGQVFICGFHSNTVVQLEPKQQKIDVILSQKDGVICIRDICYDRKQSKLLVSCAGSLLVFSLK